jgi:hypothetical protein
LGQEKRFLAALTRETGTIWCRIESRMLGRFFEVAVSLFYVASGTKSESGEGNIIGSCS